MSLPEDARYDRDDDEWNQMLRGMRKQARRFWDYVRSRSSECWLFFAAGLVFGLMIG